MKFTRILALLLFIAAAGAAGATAQTVPIQTASAKVAVIDTEEFGDAKTGIKKLVAAYQSLETTFKPRRDELIALKGRYDGLVKEINSPPAGTSQQMLATKSDQAQSLQIEIKRKQEDAQSAYNRQLATLTEPINRSIYTALEAFAKQRGIDVLIDMARFRDGMLVLNNSANITQAFIADFNAKNP